MEKCPILKFAHKSKRKADIRGKAEVSRTCTSKSPEGDLAKEFSDSRAP